MLSALDATVTEPVQIVLAGQKDALETEELLRVIRKRYLPNKVVLLADGSEGWNWLAHDNEALRLMVPIQGRTAAYVCQNFICKLPITEAEPLAQILG
jgi:uncharacterized protein YyaL (SSP411 family)